MMKFRGFFAPINEKSRRKGSEGEETEETDHESDSDEDDFENHDFNDFNKIAQNKLHCYAPLTLRNVKETLQELEYQNGRLVKKGSTTVLGRFDRLFSHPWWMVEVDINAGRSSRSTKFASSLPCYSFRCDDAVGEDVLSLFLISGCDVNDQHVTLFLEFVRNRGLRPTLVDLLNNLQEFDRSGDDNHKIAEQILKSLHKTPTGKAFFVPKLTKLAHKLFPRHVRSLFVDSDLVKLQSLNSAIEEEPWILGYQVVLKERFGVSGCEVKLSSFIECKLLDAMPVVMRDALYIYNALSKVISKYGHTYVLLRELKRQKYPGSYHVKNWEESLAYLSEINAVKTSGDVLGERRSVFLPHVRGYEQTIANNICSVMYKEPWIGSIEINEETFGGDEDQAKAANLIMTRPVVVMSGRGGCGKTHVISTVLAKAMKKIEEQGCQFDQNGVNSQDPKPSDEHEHESNTSSPISQEKEKALSDAVLLTAPTGKAASILGKRTSLPSCTLHSVIYSFFNCLKNGRVSDWKFSEVCLLVCDECSLISVKTFSTLISILMRNSKLQQIVLLGDINQLPSIEPGNFLCDVYRAMQSHGASVTLATNHRAESKLIVENAHRVSNQRMPVFPADTDQGFISLPYESHRNGDDTNTITQVVKGLLQNNPDSVSLPEPEKSQFIAFRKKDCMQINELCARHYNSHCLRDSSGKLDFQIGDKVCPRRNTECFDAYEEKKEKKKEVSVRLCNGEVFFIKDIIEEQDNRSKKITYFVIDNGERIVKIDFKMLKRAKLSHAWARTIHTYQGSEIDTVVYVVGSPFYQNWQHVYTAVTRGVRRVVIINNPYNLERAVTALPIPRQTKLEDDILQAMKNNGCDEVLSDSEDFIADDLASQTSTPGSDLANEGENPSRKRKLSESPANIGLPQTPPRFGVGASPSSHVSPSISPSPVHSNQTGETPTKTRKPFIARFNSPCKVCKSPIKAGEHEIAPLVDGQRTSWIHAKCRDEKQDTK